jgi:hypothetical protein
LTPRWCVGYNQISARTGPAGHRGSRDPGRFTAATFLLGGSMSASRGVTLHDAAAIGRQMISQIGSSDDEVDQIGVGIVSRQVRDWGSRFFLAEKEPYMFDGVLRRVFHVDQRDARFKALLGQRYGLYDHGKKTTSVISYLRSYILMCCEPLTTRRFSYYDKVEDALYINKGHGEVWRLGGETGICTVSNGDRVFFIDDESDLEPCEADIGPHGILLPTLVDGLNFAQETASHYTPEEQRKLFAAWLHVIACSDRFLAKPLLILDGAPGSGKTLAIQLVQTMLTGKSTPLSPGQRDEEDFSVQLLHSNPIAHLDNVDGEVKWLRDAICAYTTGGVWRRRKKFSDSSIHEIRPQSFVAITSANPVSFRRPDITARSVILRLEERRQTTDPESLMDNVREMRPKLMGEWLYNLNNILLAVHDVPAGGYTDRLAAWNRYVRATERAFGWTSSAGILEKAQAERHAMTIEDDPLIDLLDRWLENAENHDRAINANDLHAELTTIALTTNVNVEAFYPNGRAMAQRLRFARSALERQFKIQTHVGHKSTMIYQFARLDQGTDD